MMATENAFRADRSSGTQVIREGENGKHITVPAEQRRRELILLLVLASVQFFSIVDFMVVMPLGPQLRRTMGIDTFQFGLIVSSYTISAGVRGCWARRFSIDLAAGGRI